MKKRETTHNMIGCMIAVVIASAIGCASLRLWEVDMTVLPSIGGDGTLIACLIKNIGEYGIRGAYINYMIGAPGVSTLIDVPFLDVNLLLLIYIINKFIPNYVVVYYVVYILTYSFTAMTMYFVLNKLKLKYWIQIVGSVVFAIAPFHFFRAMGHITLSNYVTIPIGLYLAFVILEDDFCLITLAEGKRKISGKTVKVLAAAVFLGTGQLYYAFFCLIVMFVALLTKMLKGNTIKPLFHEAVIIYTTCVFVLLGIAPKIVYGWINGANTVAGIRVPMEAELYGMKIIQLLMPVSYSRISILGNMSTVYATSGVSVSENMMSSLGLLGAICFIFLCVWLICSFITRRMQDQFGVRVDFLALSTLAIVLFCTVGGLGTIFNFLVTPQVRAYNRASILILCMTLTAGALVLNKIRRTSISGMVSLVVLLVALYDQVLIHPSGWQQQARGNQQIYEAFFAEVEENVGEGDMIYQLPYMNFPEAPPQYSMTDYTPLLGYLFTDNVRWSYGGVLGRNDEAQELYADEGMSSQFIGNISTAGFCGVYIDTYGYEDGGKEIISFYSSLYDQMLVSADQRFYFFKLSDAGGQG